MILPITGIHPVAECQPAAVTGMALGDLRFIFITPMATFRFFAGLFLLLLFLVQCSSEDPDREANRLFVEAFRLIESADNLQQYDPVEVFEKYNQALLNIDRIIGSYADTDVAVNVTQQQTRIGELTIGELRRMVPLMQARAEAVDGFLNLSLYLSDHIESEEERAAFYLQQYAWYYAAGDTETATRLLAKAERLAERHWNSAVSDPIFRLVSLALADRAYWERALDTANRIQTRSHLMAALHYIVQSGYLREHAVSGVERIRFFLDDFDATEQLMLTTSMAEELMRYGHDNLAMELVRTGAPPVDADGILTYIEALINLSGVYARHGVFDRALQVAKLIEEIDGNYSPFALRDISIELARFGELEQALEMASAFERDYFRFDAVAGMAAARSAAGSVSDALELARSLPDEAPEKAEAYASIIQDLSDFGDFDRADSLMQGALTLSETIDSPIRSAQVHMQLADAYKTMGNLSEAAGLLAEAENAALQISSSETRNHILLQTGLLWIDLGRPDRVPDMFIHLRMDEPTFAELVTELLAAALRAGYHDLARMLPGITEHQPQFLYRLHALYVERGDLERARTLAYEIRNYQWRSRALADLAGLFEAEGQRTESDKVAADALLVLQRIRQSEERNAALHYTAARLAAAGVSMDGTHRTLVAQLMDEMPY